MDNLIQQQLNKQQMDAMFDDIDQLLALYQFHEKKSFDEEGYVNSGNYERLLARMDRCMVRMDHWLTQVVLDADQLGRIRKYKGQLEENTLWIAHCLKKYKLDEEMSLAKIKNSKN